MWPAQPAQRVRNKTWLQPREVRGGTGGHSHFITPPSPCPWHTRAAPKPELQLTRACLPAPPALLCAPGRSHSPAPCLADAAAAACSQPQLRGSSHTKPAVRQDRGTLPPRASQQRTRYGAASCWVRARSPFPEGLCWCCRGEERRQLLDAAERKKGEANLRVPPSAGRTQPAPQPGCAHSQRNHQAVAQAGLPSNQHREATFSTAQTDPNPESCSPTRPAALPAPAPCPGPLSCPGTELPFPFRVHSWSQSSSSVGLKSDIVPRAVAQLPPAPAGHTSAVGKAPRTSQAAGTYVKPAVTSS